MAAAGEEKTDFYTGQGVYCYTKMPFGLKNAGATYQRLMDKAFENQMGRNIEVYVDDLVIKSHTETEMVRDIAETFQRLRKINMKLIPKTYSFGLAEGVFLGPTDRTGDDTDASLLHKPCVTGSETKLLTNGTKLLTNRKAGIITGLYSKKPSKIFSGTSYRGTSVAETQEEPWTLFTDGSSCIDGSGAGLRLTNPDGVEFTYALRFQFAASNNEAEYEALIAGLRIAMQMGVKNIQTYVDSKLVANQVLGTYVAKEDNMIKYLEIAKGLVSGFKTFSISQVPQSKNKKADALSTLPADEKEARKIRLKARQYEVIEGILYKRSFLTPLLRCVGPLQAEYVMKEIHEGSCSMHAGPRAGESQVPDRRNGLLQEVDRSKSDGNDYRRTMVDIVNKDEELRLNLDLLEERRELVAINKARSKSKMTKYYNSRVRGVAFHPGDFVYRSNNASHAAAGDKLGLK
nr:reverse transcriptase domain-containing protein [Tanacetum cinerariifolium]